MGTFEIRPTPFEKTSELLRWVHCQTGEPDLTGILAEYRLRQKLSWLPQPVEAFYDGRRVAATYFSCLPGDLAMLGGVRAEHGAESFAVCLLQNQLQTIYRQLPKAHIQAAIAEADLETQQLVQAAGFQALTAVEQLWTNIADGPTSLTEHSTSIEQDVRWLPASELSLLRFERLIGATFDGTLDCPELNGVRSNQQVVRSFLLKRSLRSCPHWFTLWQRGQLAGCLLLHVHSPELVEVAYMGLAPHARGQQLGRVMMEQAKRVTAELGANLLVLAADSRNTPALKTYRRQGLKTHRRLQVYWHGSNNNPTH